MKEVHIPEDALRKAYLDDGLSIANCAERFGCSRGAIWNHLKRYGISTRSRQAFSKFQSIPEAPLRKAYIEEKQTLGECAKLFGVSIGTLRKALRYYEIPVRKGGWIKGKDYPPHARRELELPGLEALWEQGYGIKDIAFLLSASEGTIRERLKHLGIWEPRRRPTARLEWGPRCSRCGILFDSGMFSKAEGGICQECEKEMDALKGINRENTANSEIPENDETEASLSPLKLLETWKGALSQFSPSEAGKLRREWLEAVRAQLTEDKEKKLLKELQRRLSMKGSGRDSTLLLIAQIGIFFLHWDYTGKKIRKWPEAIVRAINKVKR